jgi:TRAP-type C4-dicarboxylate transport system permease small subunit
MSLKRKPLTSYEDKRVNLIVLIVLIASILITNSFIIFSPDEEDKFYSSALTSTLALSAALVISILMVFRFKKYIRKLKEKEQTPSQQSNDSDREPHHPYYDDNKIHFSICLFLASWIVASVSWTFEDQEAPGILVADVLYYIGYASFGYFLYSLYYHLFRNEFESFIPILISIIILVALILLVDIMVSTMRLLSTQTLDISLVIVNTTYPILDAIMIFPIAMMYWTIRRRSKYKNSIPEEQEMNEKDNSISSSLAYRNVSIWMLLLFVAMILSAAGDSGFAYTSASDVTTVQNYIWIWNILYNSDHLCLAAALIGYGLFFSFSKIEARSV